MQRSPAPLYSPAKVACFLVSAVITTLWGPKVSGAPGDELFSKVAYLDLQIAPLYVQSLKTNPRKDVPLRVVFQGTTNDLGMAQVKGSTGSFRPIDDKPGLTLKFARRDPAGRFCGLSKLHLNNSVEDPSYLNEALGTELFRRAKVPAPRIGFARVTLNGRTLGLYVLKEGYTEEFLAAWFKNPGGNLYDNDKGRDVDEPLDRDAGMGPLNHEDLRELAEAAGKTDAHSGLKRLENVLDLERFTTFMALEILLGHRDGYCLAKNNYRVYQDLDTERMVFLPHGMDQLLGNPDATLTPHMAGLVASAVMRSPEGQKQYLEKTRQLFDQLFDVRELTRRLDERAAAVRPHVPGGEKRAFEEAVETVKVKLAARHAGVKRLLGRVGETPLELSKSSLKLPAWQAMDAPQGGEMSRGKDPQGRAVLTIRAGPMTSASWRTNVWLTSGSYEFRGMVSTQGVKPLPFGRRQGASLRVASVVHGDNAGVTGTTNRVPLRFRFTLQEDARVDLVCELRASAGTALFEVDSLEVVRVHDPVPHGAGRSE